MINIVIGNIIALIASLTMVYTGTLKDKKKIILFQTIQIGLFVVSDLLLGGITGAIINAISLIRNILCYKEKLGTKEQFVITVLSIVLTLKFNNLGLVGLFPLISTIVYIWLMNTKNVKKLKLLIAFTLTLWFIYDLIINLYTSALFDFISIVANIVTFFKIKENKISEE